MVSTVSLDSTMSKPVLPIVSFMISCSTEEEYMQADQPPVKRLAHLNAAPVTVLLPCSLWPASSGLHDGGCTACAQVAGFCFPTLWAWLPDACLSSLVWPAQPP